MPKNRREGLMASLRYDQIDFRRQHIKAAYSTTCTWLLQDPVYSKWIDPHSFAQHNGFMWIKGKPGAGKSTLVKFALNHTSNLKLSDEILVSFFFNARGGGLEKSTLGMYRSLLWQILDKAKDIQSIFDEIVPESFQAHSSDWGIDMLRELFTMAVSRLGQRTLKCFIDALDECNETDVHEMIIHLEDLGQLCPRRYFVCFASRHYPTIVIRNGVELILEDQIGHDDDLTRYLQNHLRIDSGPFFDDILARTRKKANGVFMWVALVVPILNEEFRRGRRFAVTKRLDEIPKGLSELFKDILTRDSTDMDTLLLCLQWVLFAKQPLTREEFYFAMLAASGTEALVNCDLETISPIDMDRFVHASSKGLAELTTSISVITTPGSTEVVIESSSQVHFIHESVRDFLIKDGGLCELWPEIRADPKSISHDVLKRCCQNYASVYQSDVINPLIELYQQDQSPPDAPIHRFKVPTKFPFLCYAARQIIYHAEEAAQSIDQQDFLESFVTQRWVRESNLSVQSEPESCKITADFMHDLVCNNAPNLVRIACRMGYSTSSQDHRLRSPVFAALAWEHWDVVRALLDPPGTADLDKIVRLLVKHRPIIQQYPEEPPLLWALHKGIKPLAECFLGQSRVTEIQFRDYSGRDALSWAAERGFTEIASRLLSMGVAIDTISKKRYTPLHYAAEKGQNAMVELLLDRGSDINIVPKGGPTILSVAAQRGFYDLAELLLNAGADVNARGHRMYNALHAASLSGHRQVVQLLIERGANVNIQEGGRGNALWAASRVGHIEIVALLLENGADVNAQEGASGNALQVALKNGHSIVAQLLRNAGARDV